MGREEHCKQTSLACVGSAHKCFSCTGFAPAQGECGFLVYTAQGPGCSASNCLRWALGCVHFPGLSRSGSGSRVLHQGANSVGPAICALPRSEQLRWPSAWRLQLPPGGRCILPPPPSQPLSFLNVQGAHLLRCAVCLLPWPSQRMSIVQNPKNSWLAMEPVFSLVEDASLEPQLSLSGSGCPPAACLWRRMGQSAAC